MKKGYFFRFLKENNAYEQYIMNFNTKLGKEYRKINGFHSTKKFFEDVGSKYFITYGFIWRNTPQGYGYWDNLNCKWKKKTY